MRSRPVLSGSSTLVTLDAPERPRPGDVVTVRATVANTGSSSANDVVVLLPTPDHTVYVPRSARIDGRVVTAIDGEPFDYDSGIVAAERLAPGASIGIEYQAAIDSPLPDGTRLRVTGTVGAREVSEFALSSAEIVVASPVDFGGEETALTLLCDDAVTPGTRIPMILRAVNAGTGAAEFVTFAFALPAGLVYAPGSAQVDGQPVSDETIPGLTFSLGTVSAGRVVEAGLTATVAVPAPGAETALPVEAALRWKGGERDFARRLTARTAPRFNRARNFVEADRGSAACARRRHVSRPRLQRRHGTRARRPPARDHRRAPRRRSHRRIRRRSDCLSRADRSRPDSAASRAHLYRFCTRRIENSGSFQRDARRGARTRQRRDRSRNGDRRRAFAPQRRTFERRVGSRRQRAASSESIRRRRDSLHQ